MKIVLDIEVDVSSLNNNHVIVYRNGRWTAISKESFLSRELKEQRATNEELSARIKKLEANLVELAKVVKEK